MITKNSKFIGVSLMLFIFLAGTIHMTHAAVDMKELQAKFEKETGRPWSKASSEQRSDFMYNIRGREKKEEREERVKGVVTPFYIREGYRKEYQTEWEDATEEEQELFIEEYKATQKERDKEEKLKFKKERLRLKKIEKEKRLVEKELKLKKKARKNKAKAKQKEVDRKRKEEKRKLREAKRGRSDLLLKLKDMREQRSRDKRKGTSK